MMLALWLRRAWPRLEGWRYGSFDLFICVKLRQASQMTGVVGTVCSFVICQEVITRKQLGVQVDIEISSNPHSINHFKASISFFSLSPKSPSASRRLGAEASK